MNEYQSGKGGKGGKNGRERKKDKQKAKGEHYGSRQHIEATVNRVSSSVREERRRPQKKEINS